MTLTSGRNHTLSSGPINPGTVLAGTYEVVQHLGQLPSFGEPAFIYLGRQIKIQRDVNIRVLTTPYDQEGQSQGQERFLRDARAVARVQHPDVIKLYDIGLTEGTNFPYMVVEHLPGKTFEAHLANEGVLAPSRALRLFTRCLQLLGQAHEAGLVHRDLTPASLLLSHPGEPWERLRVQNFALAFLSDTKTNRLTQVGEHVGDPRYLAPEYLEKGIISPALDVYQMGLLFVEALTGRPPVSSRNAVDCIMAHCKGRLDVPDGFRVGPLGEVLNRALSRNHEERFANGHEFSEALSRVDAGSIVLPVAELTNGQIASNVVLDRRFELREEIGSGGFATVYEGYDVQEGAAVAIKVMRRRPDPERHAEFTRRFSSEAKMMAGFDHPNIVKTKHYGVTSAGLPYMVMEMLRGHDVEVELAQNGPMDPVRLLPMFTACLDGLGQAHATGIVHKDLKPANLFIDVSDPSRERLKVVDFGIARMGQAEEVRLTQTGQPVCTPGYAAPEYVTHLRATAAVDVYQMALILVEMLCGDPVVEDRNPLNCIMRHVKGDLTLPPSLMESPLGAVLRKALALKDTDRYPDCSAFSKALRQIDPRQLQGDSEGTQTLKVDRHELSWARSLVAALIVAQKTPDDIERLEPLVRSCVRHGQWKVSGKEWHRLREMIKGAIGRATALNKTAAVRRFESLELELEQHLGRLR